VNKPTPGPYMLHEFREGVAVRGNVGGKDISIATFWDGDIFGDSDIDRAKANARAWVEGREAVATLDKIRQAMAMVAPCERAYEVRDRVLAILEGKASP
jgi:hypothetical protein